MKQSRFHHRRGHSPFTSFRNLLAGALLGLALCAGGPAHADAVLAKGVPVKIMPVGDSITEGKYTQGGYRKPLYQMLKDSGYAVTFVGKEDNGEPANDTGFSKGMENPNHEGYGSARIGMLLGGGTTEKHTALPIKTSLANNNPDVVLIMLGTNDVFGITATDKMQQTMEKLVSSIFEQSPNITVVLASIPPILKIEARNADVDAYNAVIPQIVQKEQALGHKIVFADIHSVFTAPTDLSGDKVHPSATGYAKMAGLWYSVLTGQAAPDEGVPAAH
ncbi:MAG TPA: SGNH/GDSL hydrolase family protein [Candidatus Methylacidiphilales bacterium]